MIVYLTNAQSEILALRSILEGLPEGFPAVRAADPSGPGELPSLEGASAVLVRLLGGTTAWSGLAELRRRCQVASVPFLAFGGEATLDPEMTSLSTVAPARVAEAFEYLCHGGLGNFEQLLRFVADTFCGGSFGFEGPRPVPPCGIWRDPDPGPGPLVAVVFYRAHLLSGNTGFVEDLCEALEAKGARAAAIYCYSLRLEADGRCEALELLRKLRPDAVVTTVLVAGQAGADGLCWDASALGSLGVPVVQAVTSSDCEADWLGSDAGLSPLDVAMKVAIPEFDGRVIAGVTSFNEVVDEGDSLGFGVRAYRSRPDRVGRVAGVAFRLARLRHLGPEEKKVAIVLSAYPTKRSRIGNAVALDTPASVIELLHALREAGYRVERIPDGGDALMDELAGAACYGAWSESPDALVGSALRLEAASYLSWWEGVAPWVREQVEQAWGPAPGEVYRDPASGDLLFSGLDLGGVVVAVQPPRGFGENPVAVYHSPDLPPTHHYLAFYRWLELGFGADAVVHVGKHGSLEWLPGKSLALSGDCFPDLALGDLPLIYPFVVNDPGEGTQAKRRAHAVIVDHLLPPMTRADTYDEVAELEGLLDEHARIASLDPAKLPMIRDRIWQLLERCHMQAELGLDAPPDQEGFDSLVNAIDGYLCELKDAQIRGGLHVLGQVPKGQTRTDLVLAITRLAQPGAPSLREAAAKRLGLDLARPSRAGLDALEARCRALVLGEESPELVEERSALAWVSQVLEPALDRTTDEITAVLAALEGRFVPPGPSGAPTRGMAHVLPSGRNFYSVDPKSLPTPLAWEVGKKLAEAVLERHLDATGAYPRAVGLVVWGTSAMRTGGDDVAEALALLGVRPCWQAESGRVAGLELMSPEELGRPRVDVVVRISGFFRDAFPHLVELLDRAVELAGFDDGDPRIFGSKPGAYGSGILALLESGRWSDDADLAAVYATWGGYSYGRAGMGLPAGEAMRRRFATIEVAVKNQDNREHDIFDSDDYLQDHGGMIAAVRALTGRAPRAEIGDSSDPSSPRVRSLADEAARVVRTRVLNPKWISAMMSHGYKGAFEMAATVDYLYGYDATARVVEGWMYEKVTEAYVEDPQVRKFLAASNPWALSSMAERLLEAARRGLWQPSERAQAVLESALLEAEGWQESR